MANSIDKELLEKITDTVIDKFQENEAQINDMNVFPVPDGDTGTNMLLTLKSIKDEILKTKNPTIKTVLKSASIGALMGARGNSGVILSQILRGFFDIIIEGNEFDLDVIKEACKSSRDVAYDSVQNPTEGTMLTTIKDIYSHVEGVYDGSKDIKLQEFLDNIIAEAERSVERTTSLLPVLKQANVVDAGAQGVLKMLIGIRSAFSEVDKVNGKLKKKLKKGSGTVKISEDTVSRSDGMVKSMDKKTGKRKKTKNVDLEEVKLISEIKYTYCTELILKGSCIKLERLRNKIESYGDSALIVGNDKLVKIHVHTNTPHKVLNRSIREGTLHEIKINNMQDQRMELLGVEKVLETVPKKERKRTLIVVANGSGLADIYKSLGVDVIVGGGQSMNPSTYDIIKAVNNTDSDDILIFPNNKNILLTANQAKKLLKKKKVTVVPTRTIIEGILAVLAHNPSADLEENVSNMEKSIINSKSGEITQAVRDAKLHVGEIKKGAFIGLFNGDVRVVSDNIIDATIGLIRDMIERHEEIITFYTGKDANSKIINELKEKMALLFPKVDIEIHKGGQPLYPFIFSIE